MARGYRSISQNRQGLQEPQGGQIHATCHTHNPVTGYIIPWCLYVSLYTPPPPYNLLYIKLCCYAENSGTWLC